MGKGRTCSRGMTLRGLGRALLMGLLPGRGREGGAVGWMSRRRVGAAAAAAAAEMTSERVSERACNHHEHTRERLEEV